MWRRFLLIGMIGAITPGEARPQSLPSARSAVLLTNGNVLHGRVTLVDGRYCVASDGSEIRLAADRVAHVGGSVGELYAWQRRRVTSPTAGDRIRLAHWCVRRQMWPEAARELLDARALDPSHPRLKLAEQALEEAWRQSQLAADGRKEQQQLDAQMAEAARAAQQLRLLESLPAGSLEQFTRKVQPILVNNCTNGGCHKAGGGDSFQLNRALLHGLADRRSTFANLASVLAAVDRDRPDASPLLLAGSQPHGGQPLGVLTGRRSELHDRVSEWVRGVVRPAEEAVAAAPAAPRRPAFTSLVGGSFQSQPGVTPTRAAAPQLADRVAHAAASAEPDTMVRPALYEQPVEEEPVVEPAAFEPQPAQPMPKTAAPTAVDEFDPEIFNRRYRRETDG